MLPILFFQREVSLIAILECAQKHCFTVRPQPLHRCVSTWQSLGKFENGGDPAIRIAVSPNTHCVQWCIDFGLWRYLLNVSWFNNHICSYSRVPFPFFVIELPFLGVRFNCGCKDGFGPDAFSFVGVLLSLHWIRMVLLRISILDTILLWLQSQCFPRHTQTSMEICISVDEIMEAHPAIM